MSTFGFIFGLPIPATPLNDAHPAGYFLGVRISTFETIYTKPLLSPVQMITQLKTRGMLFSNESEAEKILNRINYYRLSAYWFTHIDARSGRNNFYENTSFDSIMNIYNYDEMLRKLVWEQIGNLEITFRRHLASILAKHYGTFAHVNPTIFENRNEWTKSHQNFIKEYDRSKERYAKHFKTKYAELVIPPIWVAIEMVSFGSLVYLFKNIDSKKVRQEISRKFNLDESVFLSYMEQLIQIRNICAHHGRLWNRNFTFAAKIPERIADTHSTLFVKTNKSQRQLQNTLVFLDYIETEIMGQSQFLEDISELNRRFSFNAFSKGHL